MGTRSGRSGSLGSSAGSSTHVSRAELQGLLLVEKKKLDAERNELLESAPVSTHTVLEGALKEVDPVFDTHDLNSGFADLDSVMITQVHTILHAEFGIHISPTLLFDYPTVGSVMDHLNVIRGVEAWDQEFLAVEEKIRAFEEEHRLREEQWQDTHVVRTPVITKWDTLSEEMVLKIQQQCGDVYAQEHYQNYFSRLTKECYPDLNAYVRAIEPALVEVEGAIFLEHDLVADMSWKSVQQARLEMLRIVCKFWKSNPKVNESGRKLISLTKQGQRWRSNTKDVSWNKQHTEGCVVKSSEYNSDSDSSSSVEQKLGSFEMLSQN